MLTSDYWLAGFTPQTIGVLIAGLVAAAFALWNAADQEWKKAEAARTADARYESQQTTLTATQVALEKLVVNQQQLAIAQNAEERLLLEQEAAKVEADRRETILVGLRHYYILSHDGIGGDLMAGMAWPPDEWMNAELTKLGETFAFTSKGPTYQTQ